MIDKIIKANSINEEVYYAHSSNSIFHFMKERNYLKWALENKGLAPRYCEENIEYLNLRNNGEIIEKIFVIQKCFCDIPLHNITKKLSLDLSENNDLDEIEKYNLLQSNTHTAFYGEFGIAFGKKWGIAKHLQPVHYVNHDKLADLIKTIKDIFEHVLALEEVEDLIVDYIFQGLMYLKPLQGTMSREMGGYPRPVKKNFYDECEWRYIPLLDVLKKKNYEPIIFNKEIQLDCGKINNIIQSRDYSDLWLKFDYDDIRYLIVPNNDEREKLIDIIEDLKDEELEEGRNRQVLISKILVLDEIKKDW